MSKQFQETDLAALTDYTYTHVIGVDEVGWGAIAGPLYVVGAVLPWEFANPGFKDSKRYTTEKARQKGAELVLASVEDWALCSVEAPEIESYGAGPALTHAQKTVVNQLIAKYPNSLVVVDGKHTIRGFPRAHQRAIIGGDRTVSAVAAASVLAKVNRDAKMTVLGPDEWEFHKNKGYPTSEHLRKLQFNGPVLNLHRMNVRVVRRSHKKHGWYNGQSAETGLCSECAGEE